MMRALTWLVFICLSSLRGYNSQLVVKEANGERWVFAEQVVPDHIHFGEQHIVERESIVHVWSEEDHEVFCDQARKNQVNNRTFANMTLLIGQKFDMTCGASLGLWINAKHYVHWCNLNATVVFVWNTLYPGIAGNIHPGDKFESLYQANPSIRHCHWLKAKIENLRAKNLLDNPPEDELTASLSTTPNLFVEFVGSAAIITLLRVVSPCAYIIVGIKALLVFHKRWCDKTLTNIHVYILLTASFYQFVLGSLGFFGLHFSSDKLPAWLGYFTMSSFFGQMVASTWLLAALYDANKRSSGNVTGHGSGKRLRHWKAARSLRMGLVFIIFDLVVSFLAMFLTETTFPVYTVIVPNVFAISQTVVTVYMFRQFSATIKKLGNLVKGTRDIQVENVRETFSKMQARLRFWLFVSICSASANVWTLWLHSMTMAFFRSPVLFVFWVSFIDFSRFMGILAQVVVCAPPPAHRVHANSSQQQQPLQLQTS